jgi:predicted ATPase
MTPRHRSMRAVFDHSWKLLSAEERTVFMKLSLFRGGCTREAAQAVAGATLPLLAGLIDKSLLRRSQSTPTRYTMHELVRQYAADQLQATGNAATVAAAHAAYYHHLVREAELQIWGAHIGDVVNRLETENDNVRVALEYYLTHPAGVEQSINLAGSLWRFWEIRGYITEGRTWLARALQRGSEPPASWRWLALHAAGNLAGDQGDYAAARQHYGESLHLLQTQLQTLTDPEAMRTIRYRIANTLNNLGYSALSQNELAQALTFCEEALTLHRQLGVKVGLGLTTTNLARIKVRQEQFAQATQFGEESLAIYRELGDERGLGWNLTTLGAIARKQGDYGRAAELYEQASVLFEKLADQADRVELYFELGELAGAQGNDAQATAHYQAGLTLAQALGDQKHRALLLARLSMVACRGGDYTQAITLSEQSIALYRTLGNQGGLDEALRHRGAIAKVMIADDGAATKER